VYVDPSYDGSQGAPAGTFTAPFTSLQAGLDTVRPGSTVIVQLSNGEYVVEPDAPLIIRGNCTILGPGGPANVIVTCRSALNCSLFQADGGPLRADSIFFNRSYTWAVTFDGITFDRPGAPTLDALAPLVPPDGLSTAGMTASNAGLSLAVRDANLTVRNCVFKGQDRGVNAVVFTGGTLLMEDVVFQNNSVWGPLFFASSATVFFNRVTVQDCIRRFASGDWANVLGPVQWGLFRFLASNSTLVDFAWLRNKAVISGVHASMDGAFSVQRGRFEDNACGVAPFDEAIGSVVAFGCALAVVGPTLTVSDTVFTRNSIENGELFSPSYGGALYVSLGEVFAQNVTFTHNLAPGGGAFVMDEAQNGEVRDCVFRYNSATILPSVFSEVGMGQGGAVVVRNSNSMMNLLIRSCVFEENFATAGGAVHTLTAGSLTLRDCSFNRNQAVLAGGALLAARSVSGFAAPTLENCSFVDNAANWTGGAVFVSATGLVVSGSTFVRNQVCCFEMCKIRIETFLCPVIL